MCEYCDGMSEEDMQEEGLRMYICDSDQLVVEDEAGNIVSHTTINYCPVCGEYLV